MTPIVCVGETLEEREAGRHRGRRCSARSTPRSPGAPKASIAALVIAYEPIWAIGTGTHGDGRGRPGGVRGDPRHGSPTSPTGDTAAAVRIQYGGSVKAGNIAELMAQPDIDGALVGGASLDPDEFAKIVNYSA